MNTINTQQTRILISFYSYFRIVLAIILISIAILDPSKDLITRYGPKPFTILSSFYLASVLFQLLQSYSKAHDFSGPRLLIALLMDEIFILGLIYLSGSFSISFGMLLITPICIAGIFFTGNKATIFAALAALGILSNHIYLLLQGSVQHQDSIQVGILGITFFISSVGIQYLSRYIRQTQQAATASELKAIELTELNRHIVQRIRTGVMIFDADENLVHHNKAAETLAHSLPEILTFLHEWKRKHVNDHTLTLESKREMQINFSSLDSKGHTITFIDDISEIAQQALQMKLAALGRLSAGIAHEIRNPLNAISHSIQLLEESPDLSEAADQRLLNIAQNHIKRIDEIIRNILGMSKQEQYQPERLELAAFVKSIKGDFHSNPSYPDIEFIVDHKAKEIFAPFDRSQLQQILINLIDNGLRYSYKSTEQFWIKCQIIDDGEHAMINIFDAGEGVPKENQYKLFEPFFTSESTGTGLGLYLSRELCILNQSQLNYIHKDSGEHYFQIRFAHADRDILIKHVN